MFQVLRQISRRLVLQRMASGLQRDWDISVNATELDDGPVYFCSEKVLSDAITRDSVKRHRESFFDTFCKEFPASIKFAFTAYNPGDVSQSDVKNAIDYGKLEKELEGRKPDGSKILKSYGFFPDDSSYFERRLSLVVSNEPEVARNARQFVNDMCLKYGQAGYFEYNSREGRIFQDLVSVPDQNVKATSPLVRVAIPTCHPVFAQPSYHSVFQNIEKLQRVLSEIKVLELDGANELLAIAAQHSIHLEGGSFCPSVAKGPVIIVEGLDAAGKTTLCKSLSVSLNATLLGSPPSCLRDLRSKFDAYPQLVRRAFYTLGNYIAAQEIASASQTGPVVVDRFWHSSAAYAIATELGCGGAETVPPEGHDIYKWPRDLLKPQVVILLKVSPEERRRRILGRGGQLTDEEMKLDKSELFQERLLECYKRMYEPSLDIVDASGSPEDVLQIVKESIKKKIALDL